MKKWAMFLCFLMLVCIVPTSALAGGGEDVYHFSVNGFDYEFSHGAIFDEYAVADNSVLCITSYNGSNLLDINHLPVPPQGLYLYEIMQATELCPEYNWEIHKNEYIPVDEHYTQIFLYFFDSNETVDIRAAKNGAEATPISFPDQKPIVANDRTLLPIRAIAEYYNWNVTWDEEQNKVVVENDTKKIEIRIGYDGLTVISKVSVKPSGPDRSYVSLDVPAMILNGRTMLPIRAVAETLGLQVEWLASENAVLLTEQ